MTPAYFFLDHKLTVHPLKATTLRDAMHEVQLVRDYDLGGTILSLGEAILLQGNLLAAINARPVVKWKFWYIKTGWYAHESFADFDNAYAEAESLREFRPGDAPDEIHCWENNELVARYDAVTGERIQV